MAIIERDIERDARRAETARTSVENPWEIINYLRELVVAVRDGK